jgi:hypothetical protein
MEKFKMDRDTKIRQWSANFRVSQERATEMIKTVAPLLRKYAYNEEYRPVDFVEDVIKIADTPDEIAWQSFEAGRLLAAMSGAGKEDLLDMANDAENDTGNGECNCPRCRAERGEGSDEFEEMLNKVFGIKQTPEGEERKNKMLEEVEAALKEHFGDVVFVKRSGLRNPFSSFALAAKDKSLVNEEFKDKVCAIVDPILHKYDYFTGEKDFDPFKEMFKQTQKETEAN